MHAERLSKLPVLTNKRDICIEDLSRLKYVHSLLCVYPAHDVWRDYKVSQISEVELKI